MLDQTTSPPGTPAHTVDRAQREALSTYTGMACRIGQHPLCDVRREPMRDPVAPDVVYQACACDCHRARTAW